jgi:hypothetical protein
VDRSRPVRGVSPPQLGLVDPRRREGVGVAGVAEAAVEGEEGRVGTAGLLGERALAEPRLHLLVAPVERQSTHHCLTGKAVNVGVNGGSISGAGSAMKQVEDQAFVLVQICQLGAEQRAQARLLRVFSLEGRGARAAEELRAGGHVLGGKEADATGAMAHRHVTDHRARLAQPREQRRASRLARHVVVHLEVVVWGGLCEFHINIEFLHGCEPPGWGPLGALQERAESPPGVQRIHMVQAELQVSPIETLDWEALLGCDTSVLRGQPPDAEDHERDVVSQLNDLELLTDRPILDLAEANAEYELFFSQAENDVGLSVTNTALQTSAVSKAHGHPHENGESPPQRIHMTQVEQQVSPAPSPDWKAHHTCKTRSLLCRPCDAEDHERDAGEGTKPKDLELLTDRPILELAERNAEYELFFSQAAFEVGLKEDPPGRAESPPRVQRTHTAKTKQQVSPTPSPDRTTSSTADETSAMSEVHPWSKRAMSAFVIFMAIAMA